MYGSGCQRGSWWSRLEPGRERLHFIFSALALASAAATSQKGRFNEV